MSVSSLDPNNALMAAIKQLSSNVASQRTISPFKNNNNGGSTADFEEVARKASGNFTKKLENF
ncbi:MAG UNVERIFIED_CONTAM: hypothetical protein LVQ98_05260 [Rickettsiaceae bacterium]|jgi:hypothetical protein